nr:DnaJ domain-containing protein [Kibdelosporangium sp. MJ126-NF4]CEL23439.1 Chaperone protein DnaJ [Kibdelosporangium sp. MJ126-NF4]CTQ96819.1 Chaperone protein DnaJ [Kibdelosporangium sp. MJ126-NF4]
MQHVDYYELLGVDENATANEIRSAYRALAKVMHPDAGGTAGTFRLLREAYETLSDPQLRAYYDSEDDEDEPAPAPVRRVARKIVRDDPNYVPAQVEIPAETIPWWHAVTSEKAVMSPPIKPEPPVLAAAIAAWTILLLALTLVSPPAPLLVIWLLALIGSGAVLFRSARRHLDVRAANRAFLARFGVNQIFGAPGVGTDHRAERLTANLLATYLTRLPAARIFHGIAEPGSVFADVDHAVLCGRRLVLIESKMWLPGHYDIDEDGEVWRNDHPFRGGSIQLADQMTEFRALWPELEVRGVLLLYPSRPGDITTDYAGAVIPPMVPADFVREIGGWLAADPITVDKKAFTEVLAQVVD